MNTITANRTSDAAETIGDYLYTWRRIYELKLEQVAERAGVSLNTLRKLEKGNPSVSFRTFLDVARSLGLLGRVEDSVDPMNSDIGRERVNDNLPQRVR